MSITLGNPPLKKTTNVQYTYQASNVQLVEGDKKYSFFLYNSGSQPSFSFTDITGSKNRYISGVSTNATITGNNHSISKVKHNAELVITHRTMTGSTFYVVVPLKKTSDSKAKTSQIDLLLESDPNTTAKFDLNIDLDNPNIIYYKLESGTDVFVFDKEINVKTDKIIDLKPSDIFTGIKKSTTEENGPFKITSHSKVEDEIECNYEGETDATVKPADVNTSKQKFIWGCALIGMLFSLLFLLFFIANENTIRNKIFIYVMLGFIGLLLFLICIGLLANKSNNTSQNITYGSLTIMSIICMALSVLASMGYFVRP